MDFLKDLYRKSPLLCLLLVAGLCMAFGIVLTLVLGAWSLMFAPAPLLLAKMAKIQQDQQATKEKILLDFEQKEDAFEREFKQKEQAFLSRLQQEQKESLRVSKEESTDAIEKKILQGAKDE